MKIAHISDLHVESQWFEKEWAENLIRILNREKPDLLIVTGDLTDCGYLVEYRKATEFLELIGTHDRVVVPGNHDARNEGYVLFEEFFGTRTPFYENERVSVVGLDSSEPDLEDGHIGRENYGYVRSILSEAKGKLKIVALHHHVVPVPGTGRERDIPVDAGDLMKLMDDLGVNLVLSGHKHKAWIWRVNSTYYITAGTATTRRLKARDFPSFNMFHLDEGFIRFLKFNVDVGKPAEEKILRI